MVLALAPLGRELTVASVRAADKVKKHLSELGICAGEKLTLLSCSGGNVIVAVKEGRLCLDRVLAAGILVA